MTNDYCYHAEKHQNSHQNHSQADGCQSQLVARIPAFVGAGGVGGRPLVGLALGAAVMGGADTGRLAFGSSGAGATVQAGLKGTAVRQLVTVAACVPGGTGAGVAVDAVNAGGAVCTRAPGTLIDVDLAAESCEA